MRTLGHSFACAAERSRRREKYASPPLSLSLSLSLLPLPSSSPPSTTLCRIEGALKMPLYVLSSRELSTRAQIVKAQLCATSVIGRAGDSETPSCCQPKRRMIATADRWWNISVQRRHQANSRAGILPKQPIANAPESGGTMTPKRGRASWAVVP